MLVPSSEVAMHIGIWQYVNCFLKLWSRSIGAPVTLFLSVPVPCTQLSQQTAAASVPALGPRESLSQTESQILLGSENCEAQDEWSVMWCLLMNGQGFEDRMDWTKENVGLFKEGLSCCPENRTYFILFWNLMFWYHKVMLLEKHTLYVSHHEAFIELISGVKS